MAETAQQYISRILSNLGDEDPFTILESTARRLRELTKGRSTDVLHQKPSPDRWSVVEILAHLADCEVVAGWRLRSVLANNGTPLQPFDQNRWADAFRYSLAPTEESLDLFEVNRRANLSLLNRVDAALFENYGMHAERGKESINHLVRLYAGHDLNHLHQVEGLLG